MKAIQKRILTITTSLLLASSGQTLAIVGLGIERDCTNIVISWPSQGYEYYLIQHRPTLAPETPWTNLTNNYPANSTNRTTYTILGVAAPCSGGGGGGGGGGNPPSPLMSSGAWSDPMVTSQEEVEPPLPLGIYPPGMDLTGRIIIWPDGSTDEWSEELVAKWKASQPVQGGAQMDSGGDSEVDSGFYRVFHIPNWSFNVTNYIYDGPTFFPVDFGDYMDRVEKAEVLVNGVATSDAILTSVEQQGQTNWGMGIYFDLLPSGTYEIQLRTTLQINDTVGEGSSYLILSNLSRTIVVDNEVTYTNWDGLIMTTNFTFRAHTKTNSTAWEIHIYDAWGNYVNGDGGYTTNGQVSWTWDLRDANGNLRDVLESDLYFQPYVTFRASTGQQVTRRTPAPQIEYPSTGAWLISYTDRFYLDAGLHSSGHQHYMNGVSGLAYGPWFRSIPFAYYPIKFGTNNYSQPERDGSWIGLITTLQNPVYRNFYYWGHGHADRIGTDIHLFDTNGQVVAGLRLPGSKGYMTSQAVKNAITFNQWAGSRPYRFVWLDGCSTAAGSWPSAWGVSLATNSISWYTNSVDNPNHRRPSVFIGWSQVVGGPSWGTMQATWEFRAQWMFNWSYYWQTRSVIETLAQTRAEVGWPPGGDAQLWTELRVYGYGDLKFNEYNQKDDWKWP